MLFAFLFTVVLAMPQTAPTAALSRPSADPSLLTVAESSDFTATSTSDEVEQLLHRIQGRSKILRLAEMGKTFNGRAIPLAILSNPPIDSIEAIRAGSEPRSGEAAAVKPVCFIMANIHAGEVEGKEACLALIREIALDPDHPSLKDLTLVIAPNYNADGNDRMSPDSRPGQLGPAKGQGQRPNAQGLDLNRDYMKLEAPETRSLAALLTKLDPEITIDCHTTNGSAHRYILTYDAPLNPSGHPAPIEFVRDRLLPEVTRRVKDHFGYDMWFYGNFEKEHSVWATYSAEPRFGGSYQGLRNQMTVLSEAYSYAPYKDRILATDAFIREILGFVVEHRAEVVEINRRARAETAAKGLNPQPGDVIGIRHRIAAFNEPAVVKGYEQAKGGEGGAPIDPHIDHGPPKDYTVVHLGRFEPTLSVRRAFAYIVPPGHERIVENLKGHGIAVEPFAGEATVERYEVTKISRAEHPFQNHRNVRVEATASLGRLSFASGSTLVRAGQPLGTLASYLLEPESEDGLATWNFFDEEIAEGKPFPIVRVRAAEDLPASPPSR